MLKKAFLLLLIFLAESNAFSQIRFDKTKKYATGNSFIESITIEDMNNDCLNDVVVMTGWYFDPDHDRTIQIFTQNQEGQLTLWQKFFYSHQYAENTWHVVVKAADLNNDNLKDVIVSLTDSIHIFYQSAGGSFNTSLKLPSQANIVNSIDVRDIDNDGLIDIALCGPSRDYTNTNYGIFNIFYQQRDNTLLSEIVTVSGNSSFEQIKIADLNHDCYGDLIAIGDGKVSVAYLNKITTQSKVVTKEYNH